MTSTSLCSWCNSLSPAQATPASVKSVLPLRMIRLAALHTHTHTERERESGQGCVRDTHLGAPFLGSPPAPRAASHRRKRKALESAYLCQKKKTSVDFLVLFGCRTTPPRRRPYHRCCSQPLPLGRVPTVGLPCCRAAILDFGVFAFLSFSLGPAGDCLQVFLHC